MFYYSIFVTGHEAVYFVLPASPYISDASSIRRQGTTAQGTFFLSPRKLVEKIGFQMFSLGF